MMVAGLGLFLATLDTGIVNVALPSLEAAWRVAPQAVTWVVAAYTASLAATVMFWGHLADRLGPPKIFGLGLGVFGAASLLCGAAPSLTMLVGARTLQGLGSAMVQGTAAALLLQGTSASRRAAALATLAVFQGLGPVIGPSVGGLVLTWLSWRWLFWLNIPVTVSLLIALRRARLRGAAPQHTPKSLSMGSQVLLAGAILAGLMSLSQADGVLWAAGALLLVAGWWIRERSVTSPLVPRPLLSDGPLWAAVLAVTAVGGATALVFLIPPYVLGLYDHWPPALVGLVNMSAPAALVVAARPLARTMPRLGAPRLMTVGLLGMVVATGALGWVGAAAPPVVLSALLVAYGVGAAAFFPSNLSILMGRDASRGGLLGALQRMGINLGTAIDATVAGALLTTGAGVPAVAASGVRLAWAYGAATLLVAAGVAALVNHRMTSAPTTRPDAR